MNWWPSLWLEAWDILSVCQTTHRSWKDFPQGTTWFQYLSNHSEHVHTNNILVIQMHRDSRENYKSVQKLPACRSCSQTYSQIHPSSFMSSASSFTHDTVIANRWFCLPRQWTVVSLLNYTKGGGKQLGMLNKWISTLAYNRESALQQVDEFKVCCV